MASPKVPLHIHDHLHYGLAHNSPGWEYRLGTWSPQLAASSKGLGRTQSVTTKIFQLGSRQQIIV